MSQSLGPLTDGSRVAIVGGGPGGTGCALALERSARALNRKLQITIIEGKQFRGERHYNQCAGVLSPPLPALLETELAIPFPYDLCREEISSYVLHTDRERITLSENGQPSIALRRIQFDAYMLDKARECGIDILPARAVDVEFHSDGVIIYTENTPVACDVIVGAFGLDEGTAAIFSHQTSYRPPKYLVSIVTKYHPGEKAMAAFGPAINAFLTAQRQIEFGAVTPKGNHLTINIAGQHVDIPAMEAFLASATVQRVLPNLAQARRNNSNDLTFFKGRFPRALAHGFYGDRFVLVGDSAGLVRAFKGKGVTSAVQTGIRAAQTMLEAGISHRAFHSHYRQANQDIIGDLPYGRLMRRLTILASRYKLLDPVIRAAKTNPTLQEALFGAVSGHALYRDILLQMLRPGNIAAVLREIAGGSSQQRRP
jgi:flavin-dependent dehydrogenase